MFWVRAISKASSDSSRVVRMFNLSYTFIRSWIVEFASSVVRSLCILTCFHMAFRVSARAMSTLCRERPSLRAFVIDVLASLEPGSFVTSFTMMLESRTRPNVLYPL